MNRVKLRVLLLLGAGIASGCSCNKGLTESPPAELATLGIVIDQPAEGASLTGAWTTVSGWVSPDWVQGVLVVGAPVDGYYVPAGHVGVPTVPVAFRKDGRFFAPRVPLQDGQVKLTLIPLGNGGSTYEALTRTVNVSGASTAPATLVVDPAVPEPGQSTTLRATTGENLSTSFQWDFDGDGAFEAEGASVTHAWATAGRYQVIARTLVEDRWVSAFALVVVANAPKVLATAPAANPTRIFFSSVNTLSRDDAFVLPDGGVVPRDLVAVVDGDLVRVFAPDLTPRFVLSGLSEPSGVVRDSSGGILVADTGHDRLVRFTATGALDTTFATNGEYRGTTIPTKRPVSLRVDGQEVLLEDGTILECQSEPQFGCDATTHQHLEDELEQLAAQRIERFVMKPGGDTESLFLSAGRLLKISSVDVRERAAAKPVVDAVAGPDDVQVNYAIVDERGRVHIYRWPWHEGPFTLPYSATCLGADRSGRLYVGGPGVIELRDFEPLR